MKILFIANRAEFGGAPKSMLELIEILMRDYGITIEVVTSSKNAIAKFCEERNIKYYAVGHTSFAVGKGSTPIRRMVKTLLLPYYYIKCWVKNKNAFLSACEQIDFSEIDIIHTNSNRDCLGAMLNKKYHIPHVWHLREFGKEDYNIRYLKFKYIDFMNKNTTSFIAISDAVKRAWCDKGLEESKIVRVYNGIKLPNGNFVKKKNDDETLRFAYLGIVCPSKGQFDAIKALSKVDKNIAQNIRIDFWGDCNALPEYTNKMKHFAKKHGINNYIKFCGFSDNIWEILPNYDAAMVCSRAEAFGRITPEYMSNGLLVIAGNTGANSEIIEDGISGYIYEHSDLQQLADTIEKVYLSSDEDKILISENAKKRAKFFSDKNYAKNIVDFYSNLLSED